MTKTIIYEFSDNFEFPKQFVSVDTVLDNKPCRYCPFYWCDTHEFIDECALLGENETECPFYKGVDEITIDCRDRG